MRIHYVIAHPSKDSFNAALLARAKSVIPNKKLTVTDLYAQHFNPVASLSDTTSVNDSMVQDEINHIKNADLLILQFPLWWFSMPAILKGWMDRVFVAGVAYDKKHRFATGGFAAKKAMIVTTTQGPADSFSNDGMNGPITSILWPIHHALLFVGFKTLKPFIGFGVLNNTKEENESLLMKYESALTHLEERKKWTSVL